MNKKNRKTILIFFLLFFFGIGFSPVLGQNDRTPNPDIIVLKNIPYVTDGQTRQQLDLYVPKDYELSEKSYPLILVVHGGGWRTGSKEDMSIIANWLVPKGYIVAFNNYRLLGEAFFPAQLQDCKSAVRWLKANAEKYKIDKTRFGAYGASAGGHLVCMLGSTAQIKEFDVGEHLDQSSDIQVVADLFGVISLVSLPRNSDISIDIVGKRFFGPDVANAMEALQMLSPITHVKTSVPTIIMHGTADELVPYEQSVLYDKLLREAGIDCEFITVPGAKHEGDGFFTPDVTSRVEAFFAKYLK